MRRLRRRIIRSTVAAGVALTAVMTASTAFGAVSPVNTFAEEAQTEAVRAEGVSAEAEDVVTSQEGSSGDDKTESEAETKAKEAENTDTESADKSEDEKAALSTADDSSEKVEKANISSAENVVSSKSINVDETNEDNVKAEVTDDTDDGYARFNVESVEIDIDKTTYEPGDVITIILNVNDTMQNGKEDVANIYGYLGSKTFIFKKVSDGTYKATIKVDGKSFSWNGIYELSLRDSSTHMYTSTGKTVTIIGIPEDSPDPIVKGISFDKTNVEPGDVITITVDAISENAIDYVEIYLQMVDLNDDRFNHYAIWNPIKPDESEKLKSEIKIDNSFKNGTYEVQSIYVKDEWGKDKLYWKSEGNFLTIEYDEDRKVGHSVNVEVDEDKFTVTDSPGVNTAPKLKAIEFDKDTVVPGDTVQVWAILEEAEEKADHVEIEVGFGAGYDDVLTNVTLIPDTNISWMGEKVWKGEFVIDDYENLFENYGGRTEASVVSAFVTSENNVRIYKAIPFMADPIGLLWESGEFLEVNGINSGRLFIVQSHIEDSDDSNGTETSSDPAPTTGSENPTEPENPTETEPSAEPTTPTESDTDKSENEPAKEDTDKETTKPTGETSGEEVSEPKDSDSVDGKGTKEGTTKDTTKDTTEDTSKDDEVQNPSETAVDEVNEKPESETQDNKKQEDGEDKTETNVASSGKKTTATKTNASANNNAVKAESGKSENVEKVNKASTSAKGEAPKTGDKNSAVWWISAAAAAAVAATGVVIRKRKKED